MKTTQIEQQKIKMEESRKQVMASIELNELAYNYVLYDAGINLLGLIYGLDTKAFKAHATSKLFWSWFRVMFFSYEENYLARETTLKNCKNLPIGLTRSLFMRDMNFFCGRSKFMMKSFTNYLSATESKTQPNYGRSYQKRLRHTTAGTDRQSARKARAKS